MMNNIIVSYSKIYMDDTGMHYPDFFKDYPIKNIAIQYLFRDVFVDFVVLNCACHIVCLNGYIRVVHAYETEPEYPIKYKFKQYFMRGMDGKVLTIEPNTSFGYQSLNDENSILAIGVDVNKYTPKNVRISFDW